MRVGSQRLEELFIRLVEGDLGDLREEITISLLRATTVGSTQEDDAARLGEDGSQGGVSSVVTVVVRLDERFLDNQSSEAVADEDDWSRLAR